MHFGKTALLAGFAALGMVAVARAQTPVKIGIITSMSGGGASIGVPYAKGIAAWQAGNPTRSGQPYTIIQMDDASDPAVATRAAKKLIEEDHVDVIVGAAITPPTLAIYGVASEAKVPMVMISNSQVPGERGDWEITIPQPVPLMVAADITEMKKAGVKTVAYIGFSDGFGDLVYNSLVKAAEPAGIKVITDERYARTDTSVTPQILKIIAAHPDAVFTGGSGSPGALPHLALAEHGYHGKVYSTHAIINAEFVHVGGASVEGLVAPTGPVVVAEQLPDSNPIKAVALKFRALYEQANHAPSTDAFAAYGYDGMLITADAIHRLAGGAAKPGTADYRLALRDALESTHELVGTHAVYNFKPGDRYGTDERSRVMVKLVHGQWKLVQ
jgi:branched-chain amino acid transport system substrate-binding protein